MNKLTPAQAEVLTGNTITAIENGFASKYHAVIKEDYDSAEEFRVELEQDKDADAELTEVYRKYAKNLGRVLVAEAPIVFYMEPSNMARAVFAGKVYPDTGEVIDSSRVFVGLVGGLAGVGNPHYTFDADHLAFAVESIKIQESNGLEFNILL